MKKVIKKYLEVFLVVTFAMTMFGCGAKDVNTAAKPEEKTKETVASDTILEAKQYDKSIQLGGKVLNLPAKFTDFIEAGAVLTSKELSEDYIMDKKSNKSCNMTINNTKFQLYLENNADRSASLKDSDVKYISNIQGKDIYFNGGIHIGSKLDELTEKWGQPSLDASNSGESSIKYCYFEQAITPERLKTMSTNVSQDPISGTGNEYTIVIDRKTGTITDIKYKWSLVDTNTLTTDSKDIRFGNDKFKISYKMPSFLLNSDNHNVVVCIIDNVPYIIIADNSFQGLGDSKENITDEKVKATINDIDTEKYDVEILKKTDNEAYACGYSTSGNTLKCQTLYMNREHYYKTYKWQIAPLDEKGTLTDSAIKKFKSIVTDFTESIQENKA